MVKNKIGSTDRFGYEWQKYDKLLPEYEEQFLRWTCLIKKDQWKDKAALDVGCGAGRNSYWPLKFGAKNVVAIDLDERSLDSARKNLASFPKVQIKEMSAYNIEYEEKFDVSYSIGVIHHLENPKLAMMEMVKATKVGGTVLIWVYGKENMGSFIKILNPFRKYLFSKLPISVTHFLSIFPAFALWILLKMNFGKIEYFNLIRKFSFWHLRSIVFDQMLPVIANYWTKEEVLDLMNYAGLKNINITQVNGMSWCCTREKGNS